MPFFSLSLSLSLSLSFSLFKNVWLWALGVESAKASPEASSHGFASPGSERPAADQVFKRQALRKGNQEAFKGASQHQGPKGPSIRIYHCKPPNSTAFQGSPPERDLEGLR